jgi:hypothetical protein
MPVVRPIVVIDVSVMRSPIMPIVQYGIASGATGYRRFAACRETILRHR